MAPAWEDTLGARLCGAALELAQRATADELALFIGAGVSVGAGLPAWQELLTSLAERDDVRRKAGAPGPGSYSRQHATGEQALGGYRTQPSFRFGAEARFGGPAGGRAATGAPSYTARSSVGKQVVSERRSTPSYGFGSARRFADRPSANSRRVATPGPGSYNA